MRRLWAAGALVWAQGSVAIGQWGVYAYHGHILAGTYMAPYFWILSTEGVVLLHAEEGSYRELNRTTGLLYNRPTALYGDPASGWVFLGYHTGEVQYGPAPERLLVWREIAANPLYTSRAVRDFAAKGDTLLVATDFGLVVWDKRRQQALATVAQFPGVPFSTPVWRVTWAANAVWAFTDRGLYALPEGRPWASGWQKRSGPPWPISDSVQYWQGWVEAPEGFLMAYRDTLYRWTEGQGWTRRPLGRFEGQKVRAVGGSGLSWGLSLDTPDVLFFSPAGDTSYLWNPAAPVVWSDPSGQYRGVGSTWIGAIVASPKGQFSTDAHQRLRGGNVTEVVPAPQGLFFLHGGTGFWGEGYSSLVTYYPYDAQQGLAYDLTQRTGKAWYGMTEALWDGGRLWIACRNGVLTLTPEGQVDTFTAYNAPFDGLFPDSQGYPTTYGFTTVARSASGTIWLGKRFGSRNVLAYFPASGRWQAFSFLEPVLQIRADNRGYVWVLHAGGVIRVIDDRGAPEAVSAYRIVTLSAGVGPLAGLPDPALRTLAADRSGALWLGTEKGVAVLYGDPFAGTLSLSVPVIENRYLLEEETITDIRVDGQNRKWIGTLASGVYVISAEGSRQLASFNQENSPLPANLVFRIRSWDLTGETFMITSEGVVSYRDWATEPAAQLDSLHIFPNPVSRDFSGWVGIRGLSEGSTVRIFTVDGQVVRYLQAFGGQAVWDLRTIQGERVSPGVYLVGALDADGQRSVVGKIVILE